MGRTLKKYNSLDNTVIFRIENRLNQEKGLEVHLLRSAPIFFFLTRIKIGFIERV